MASVSTVNVRDHGHVMGMNQVLGDQSSVRASMDAPRDSPASYSDEDSVEEGYSNEEQQAAFQRQLLASFPVFTGGEGGQKDARDAAAGARNYASATNPTMMDYRRLSVSQSQFKTVITHKETASDVSFAFHYPRSHSPEPGASSRHPALMYSQPHQLRNREEDPHLEPFVESPSRSEKRAATDSGTDDDLGSARGKKRRKQSKPVRISSDAEAGDTPALQAPSGRFSAEESDFRFPHPRDVFTGQQTTKTDEVEDNKTTGHSEALSFGAPSIKASPEELEDKAQNKSFAQDNDQEEGQIIRSVTSNGMSINEHHLTSIYSRLGKEAYGFPFPFSLSKLARNSKASNDSESPGSSPSISMSPARSREDEGDLNGQSGELSLQKFNPVSGLLQFPSNPFLFPFLNPTGMSGSPGGQSRHQQQQSSNGGPPLRIFNHEAFCELCNKEFCNKYFLKTHKANKHGIYSDGITTSTAASSVPTTSTVAAPVASLASPLFSASFGPPVSLSTGAPPPYSMGRSHSSNALTSVHASAESQDGMHHFQAPGKNDFFPLWSGGSLAPSPLTPTSRQSSGIINPEAYCELCQKEFCNKYFLKRHKAKMHGIVPDTSGSGTGSTQTSPKKSKSNSSSSLKLADNLRNLPTMLQYPSSDINKSNNTTLEGNYEKRLESSEGTEGLVENVSLPADPSVRSSHVEPSFSDLHGTVTNSLGRETSKSSIAGGGGDSDDDKRGTDLSLGSMKSEPNRDSLKLLKIPTPSLSMFAMSPTGDKKSLFSPERLRQMGVINAEAFCEICCKEFCNKYFLRTHKYKKHGIGSPPENDKGKTPESMEQNVPLNLVRCESQKSGDSAENLVSDRERLAEVSEQQMLQCDACHRTFQSVYLLHMHRMYFHSEENGEREAREKIDDSEKADTAAVMGSNDKHLSEEKDTMAANEGPREHISEDLKKLQSMISELNSAKEDMRVTCRVCRRQVEKTQLATHMQNEHGAQARSSDNLFSNGGGIVKINTDVNENANQTTFCTICNKDFFTGFFYKTHMQNFHGVAELLSPEPAPFSKSNMDRFKMELLEGGKKGEKKNSGAPTRSYCEICNKELCNKYFMKTHMLKMHGINLENGAQIGGVTCDICNKELCSKYFLKVHKQNTHGIMDDANKDGVMDLSLTMGKGDEAPASTKANSSQGNETCLLCQKRFKGAKSLKAHIATEHDEREREELHRLTQERRHSSALFPALNGPQSCYICGQFFPEIIALQVHMIKSHASQLDTPPAIEDAKKDEAVSLKTESTPSSSLFEVAGSKTFQCSFCDFSTTSLTYFFAHERSHTNISLTNHFPALMSSLLGTGHDSSKTVQCPLCQQNLPLDMFQHHLLAHQLPSFLQTLIPQHNEPNEEQFDQLDEPASTGIPETSKMRTAKRFRCTVCRKRFTSRPKCLYHIMQKHPLPGNSRRLQCRKCKYSTRSPQQLSYHVRKRHCENVVTKNKELENLPPYMAVPQGPVSEENFVLQAFMMSQPSSQSPTPVEGGRGDGEANFVPSVILLPVNQKVSSPLRVTFNLTPA